MWRHTLFLNAFIFDKLWSLYLGRPSTIPVSTVQTAHNRELAAGWSGPSTLDSWIGLCCDISEATDILNGASPLDSNARKLLLNLDDRIQRRAESLPSPLRLNKDRVSELAANAYSLHIQFLGIRIVLHRLMYALI